MNNLAKIDIVDESVLFFSYNFKGQYRHFVSFCAPDIHVHLLALEKQRYSLNADRFIVSELHYTLPVYQYDGRICPAKTIESIGVWYQPHNSWGFLNRKPYVWIWCGMGRAFFMRTSGLIPMPLKSDKYSLWGCKTQPTEAPVKSCKEVPAQWVMSAKNPKFEFIGLQCMGVDSTGVWQVSGANVHSFSPAIRKTFRD